jgi:CO dehydrogenase/acetyl-CoA synthase alpha subunit
MNPLENAPSFECPIILDLNDALEQAQSFARSMRKLRKSMQRCPACEHYQDCPVMQQFRMALDAALEEITREWNLKG